MPVSLSRRTLLLTGVAVLGLAAFALPGLLPDEASAEAAPSAVMGADEAFAKAKSGEITLIDIRTPEEWAQTGVPEGALALDLTQQKSFLDTLVMLRQADGSKPIALICRTGNRSGYVVKTLAAQGFPGLVDVTEGVVGGRNGKGWLTRGLPTYKGDPDEIRVRLKQGLPKH
ncbi:MAG: rhodanese-like domain-containing protein [Paracoccaceae bacterium]